MYKIWQTWEALKRDKTHWYNFIIDDIWNIEWENCYTIKITSWDKEWKYSYIWETEIDNFLIFDK